MRDPGACDEAVGVSGAFQGGVAATRGVEARPRSEDVTLLRAESRRSASAKARSRMAVGSFPFGVVGVCGSFRKKLKHWASSCWRWVIVEGTRRVSEQAVTFTAGAADQLLRCRQPLSDSKAAAAVRDAFFAEFFDGFFPSTAKGAAGASSRATRAAV